MEGSRYVVKEWRSENDYEGIAHRFANIGEAIGKAEALGKLHFDAYDEGGRWYPVQRGPDGTWSPVLTLAERFEREDAAKHAIHTSNMAARSDGRSIEAMEPNAARQMAREDLQDLREIQLQPRLNGAALTIADNISNPAYKAEFERRDFEAAKAVGLMALSVKHCESGAASTSATVEQEHMRQAARDVLTPHEKAVIEQSRAILNDKALGDQFTESALRELEARLRSDRARAGGVQAAPIRKPEQQFNAEVQRSGRER